MPSSQAVAVASSAFIRVASRRTKSSLQHRIDNGPVANSLLTFQEVLLTYECASIVLGHDWYGTHN